MIRKRRFEQSNVTLVAAYKHDANDDPSSHVHGDEDRYDPHRGWREFSYERNALVHGLCLSEKCTIASAQPTTPTLTIRAGRGSMLGRRRLRVRLVP